MSEPISFSFEPTVEGAHAHVVVRCGVNGSRAHCGTLTMRVHEWHLLRWLLATTPPLDSNEQYVPVWAREFPGNVIRSIPIDNTPVVCQPERMAEVIGERLDAAVAAARASSGEQG